MENLDVNWAQMFEGFMTMTFMCLTASSTRRYGFHVECLRVFVTGCWRPLESCVRWSAPWGALCDASSARWNSRDRTRIGYLKHLPELRVEDEMANRYL